MEQTKQDLDYDFCMRFLALITGQELDIAIASAKFMRVENALDDTCWQVMADPDTPEGDFFDWYCWQHEHEQFHESIYECVTRYLYFRELWIKKGKPKVNYGRMGQW